MSKKFTPRKNRRGQGLVEYIFIVAGVAFVALLAVSIFGHKVSDQYAISAGLLPGAHAEDNLPVSGLSFLETTDDGVSQSGTGIVSWGGLTGADTTTGELINNVGVTGVAEGDAFVAE